MRTTTIFLGLFTALVPANAALAADDMTCDRRCMHVALDQLLDSMVRHDVALAPLADNYRGTENQHEVAAGKGLWRTMLGLGPLQRRFFDADAGQAAYYGYVTEPGGPALLSLRVRFDGNKINESEAIVAREGEPLYNISDAILYQPRADSEVHKSSRDTMETVVNAYFDGLAYNTSENIPKIDGCERVENGTKVTHRTREGDMGGEAQSGDCTAGFENMTSIEQIAFRRVPVADTQAGVALGVGLFQRPLGATDREGNPRKRNLIHEYFALEDGRISEIFAVMRYIDHDEPNSTGWPTEQ